MSGKDLPLIDKFLNGIEYFGKICRVSDNRSFIPDPVKHLGETTAPGLKSVPAHINIDQTGVWIVYHYRFHDFPDIAYLRGCRYYNGSRREHGLVGIFLCHRQAVLAGRYVYSKVACKFAGCLDCLVQSCIFALVLAWPGPVRGERYAFQSVGQRRPNNICKGFGDRQHRSCFRVD